MIISTSSNLHTLKGVHGFNFLDIQICFVYVPQELSLTMLQLANIGLGSSQVKSLSVHVETIL